MEINIWFDVCAIFILAVILLTFYMRNSVRIYQNVIFSILVWQTLFSTIFDLMGGAWQSDHAFWSGIFPMGIFKLINYGYFIAHNATPFFFAFYVMATLNCLRKYKGQFLWLYLPVVIDVILIAVTPFTDAVFYLDEYGFYQRGNLLFILYLIAAYYLLVGIGMVVYYRKVMPLPRRAAFSSFVFLAMVSVCVQYFYPFMLVEGFGTTICLLLVYLTIQRPEEMLDGSTGLLNKTVFTENMSVNSKQSIDTAVILVIIDEFTLVEKSLGLEGVKRLMSMVSGYFRQYSKKAGVYRVADDRICVVLNRFDLVTAEKYIGGMKERFARSWTVEDFCISLTAHFSLIRYMSHADTPERLMELMDIIADEAARRKEPVITVDSLDVMAIQRNQDLDGIVKEAVINNWLEVVYQPIYSPEKKRFDSAEALLRLKHDELGYIPPDEFIPIAEENGEIIKIGHFVLDTVCRFISENDMMSLGIEYIEVNLSIVECLQDNLAEIVLNTLDKYGLLPSAINLEITETAANTLPDSAVERLNYLASKGIAFSLDDYGTGYSNIVRMLSLPIHIVKIDRSIVQAAFTSKLGDIILESTCGMITKIEKVILAEGVETEEQAERLMELGCEHIQGYYYSKPVPPQAFLKMVKKHLEKSQKVLI